VCSFSALTLLVGSFYPVKHVIVPDMTYNVFGGTLNLTQSINHYFKNMGNILLYLIVTFHLMSLSAVSLM